MNNRINTSTIFQRWLNALLIALACLTCGSNAQAIEQKQSMSVEIISSNNAEGADKDIIGALKKLLHALELKDLDLVSACLSADVTTSDSKSGRALYGKEAVLEHVKKSIISNDKSAVKKLTVYDPYVSVKGETAMVSFRATKDLADNSTKLESWCSEVYERKNGDWLVLRLKTDWKPIKNRPVDK